MTNYSGRTTQYTHKRDDWENHEITEKRALRRQLVLDVQWSDCPVEVEEEVKEIWHDFELGNDDYFKNLSINDCEEHGYNIVAGYLRELNVKPDEDVWIHWWW